MSIILNKTILSAYFECEKLNTNLKKIILDYKNNDLSKVKNNLLQIKDKYKNIWLTSVKKMENKYKVYKKSRSCNLFLLSDKENYLIFFQSNTFNTNLKFVNFQYEMINKIEIYYCGNNNFYNGEAAFFPKQIYDENWIINIFSMLELKILSFGSLGETLKDISEFLKIERNHLNANIIGFLGEIIFIYIWLQKVSKCSLEFRKNNKTIDFYDNERKVGIEVKTTCNNIHQHKFTKNQISSYSNKFLVFSVIISLSDNEKDQTVQDIIDSIYQYNYFLITNNISINYLNFIKNTEILKLRIKDYKYKFFNTSFLKLIKIDQYNFVVDYSAVVILKDEYCIEENKIFDI